MTGDGIEEFFEAVDTSREEYERYVNEVLPQSVLMYSREYLPELERARAARDKSLQDAKNESMARLTKDLAGDKQRSPTLGETWEEDDDADEDGEDNTIDACELPSRI